MTVTHEVAGSIPVRVAFASVAQLVERMPEEHGVAGSTPAGGTNRLPLCLTLPPQKTKKRSVSNMVEGQRGRPKRGKIRALIDRLRKYKGEVCRFADNPLVPFTNNQDERDLRMVKVKNKVIGTFRSLHGANDFLILKSLTSTATKAGFTAFDDLLSLIFGRFALED